MEVYLVLMGFYRCIHIVVFNNHVIEDFFKESGALFELFHETLIMGWLGSENWVRLFLCCFYDWISFPYQVADIGLLLR